jgi:hypothetical protein
MSNEVTVLWWRYSDGSAAGIERVYASHEDANADQQMLADAQASKQFFVERLPVLRTRPNSKRRTK